MSATNILSPLRVALVQSEIIWEDKIANFEKATITLSRLLGKCDIAVLPEMFSTGFSMNSHELAEDNNGATINQVKRWAATLQIAICGSFVAQENGRFFNRGFFITPQQECYFYDKRHLFRMGSEDEHFASGDKRMVVEYLGWKICLLICYDLRFPVWSRNFSNEYDLLIYCANWPSSRIFAWNTLLTARAIENAAYVCGVNRMGVTPDETVYPGCSAMYDMKGKQIVALDYQEGVVIAELNLSHLKRFRDKFPVWKDADTFTIE